MILLAITPKENCRFSKGDISKLTSRLEVEARSRKLLKGSRRKSAGGGGGEGQWLVLDSRS